MTVPHLFWPDMATIHYSKEVENWLNSMNIRFVSRIGNAPNVPIADPLRDFGISVRNPIVRGHVHQLRIVDFRKYGVILAKRSLKDVDKVL